MTRTAQAGDLGEVLAVLREHAVALAVSGPLSAAGTPSPSRIRVEASGVVVELDWPGAGTVLVPTQPAAPAFVAAPVPAPAAARNGNAPAPAGPAAPEGHRLTAPTVGVFYRSPEPGAPPFVAEGDTVTAGQQLAIIEAMKLMIPVEADRGGRLSAVLGVDGTSVEYGEPLFVIAGPGS